MANVQRLLGTLLASRMAGRGGMGGALGSAAMMGLGGPLLRSKAGLAALGYLAYRSYSKNQGSAGGQQAPGSHAAGGHGGGHTGTGHTGTGHTGTGHTGTGHTGTGQAGTGHAGAGLMGGGQQGIGGMISGLLGSLTGDQRQGGQGGQSLADRIANALNPQAGAEAQAQAPEPEEMMSDGKALLLIRAMIAAAYSDGQITPDERARICGKVEEAGADPEDKRLIERELDNPKPLDVLLKEVNDRETAQQFYLASRAAVEGATPTQQSYLTYLRQRLALPEDDVQTVEKLASGG